MDGFKRVILSLLAVVVFGTSTVFAVDTHYCEDQLQSIAVFQKAMPCGKMEKLEAKKLSSCCMRRQMELKKSLEGKTTFKKAKCCHNESVGFRADLQLEHATQKLIVSPELNAQIARLQRVSAFNGEFSATKHYFNGPPEPQRVQDLLVFYQVFQI